MRVALSFPGCHRRGGVERIVHECARYLADRSHQVDIYANEWERIENSKVSYHRVTTVRWPQFLGGLSYFRNATRQLSGGDYDVLNTHGLECPLGGVHWAQSLHAAWLDRARQFRPAFSSARFKQRVNPLHPMLLYLERAHFGQRAYQHVVVTTPRVRQDLYDYYDVPVKDVTVIPNGFSPNEFSPQRRSERRPAARERLGLRPDEIVLLFVANELDRKGYKTILDAMRILDRSDLRLLVVGRAPTETVLKRAEEAGMSHAVSACGPTGDVSEYHAAADLFVLPTQYEAFCLAILEALGSGLPVVTTNVPGACDAIVPGVNGTIVADPLSGEELAAALVPLLETDRRNHMSQLAPGTVEAYQWPTVLKKYEEVLLSYCKN